MTENPAAKVKQARNKKYMLVRYGRMNSLGFFEHQESRIPRIDARVVVKTDKGLELGQIVGQLASYKAGQFRLSEDQVKKYFDSADVEPSFNRGGKFIRFATAADISEDEHLRKISREEIE
jgi:hypothetical protein